MLDSSKIGAQVSEIGAHLDGVGAQLEGVGMPDYMCGLIRAVEVLPDPETLAASEPDAQVLGAVIKAINEVVGGISGVREELVSEAASRKVSEEEMMRYTKKQDRKNTIFSCIATIFGLSGTIIGIISLIQ